MNDICSATDRSPTNDNGKMETVCALAPSVAAAKPMSYSAEVTGNFSDVVKSAVVESMHQQKKS